MRCCSDPPLLHPLVVGPVRRRSLLSSAHDAWVNLAVAQSAMLKTKCLEFSLESFMLAGLTSVVFLGKDALTRRYARGEMTSTLVTVYVELAYHSVAVTLRTLHLLIGPISGWMPREKLDRQVFILLTLLLCQFWESLQFDESLRAISVTLIEETGYGHYAIDFLRGEFFLIFNQSHRCLHSTVVFFLIELTLAKQEEVYSLCTFPRIR